jgi:hypothetical protein
MRISLAMGVAFVAISVQLGAQGTPPPKDPDPPDAGAPKARREKGKDPDDPKAGSQDLSSPDLSIDEKYVRERLKGFLHPTRISFAEGGRVKLVFDLSTQSPDQAGDFTPRISKDVQSNFRWSRGREKPGLRIANGGAALLNCWFENDVEAVASYYPGTNYAISQTAALVLVGEKETSLGSNFGAECVVYSRGVAVERRAGDRTRPEASRQASKLKLVVREGTFEAHLDGVKQAEMRYKRTQIPTGRIGFLWGGGVAGIVTSLEIEGKLDLKRTAREIRIAE